MIAADAQTHFEYRPDLGSSEFECFSIMLVDNEANCLTPILSERNYLTLKLMISQGQTNWTENHANQKGNK